MDGIIVSFVKSLQPACELCPRAVVDDDSEERHERTHPDLTAAGEGWYSIYLPRRDGRLS